MKNVPWRCGGFIYYCTLYHLKYSFILTPTLVLSLRTLRNMPAEIITYYDSLTEMNQPSI